MMLFYSVEIANDQTYNVYNIFTTNPLWTMHFRQCEKADHILIVIGMTFKIICLYVITNQELTAETIIYLILLT